MNRSPFRRWRRIATASSAGLSRRFGIVAMIAMAIVMFAWFAALRRFPAPADPFTHEICRLAMFCGLATMFAQFHGMASLRSRFAIPVIVCGAACFGLGAWSLARDSSAGVLVRLSLPTVFAAMMWHYVFVISAFRGRYRSSKLRVGERFPDFDLPDTRNRARRLGSILDGRPALLVFYKGDW